MLDMRRPQICGPSLGAIPGVRRGHLSAWNPAPVFCDETIRGSVHNGERPHQSLVLDPNYVREPDMHQDFCKLGLVCAFVLVARLAIAQSIEFSPAAPTGGEAVFATLSQPFSCEAQQPALTASSADSFTFDSIFPYGIVNCPFIPFPPPTTSSFSVSLGSLLAGTYTVTWNIYLSQSSGAPTLLSSTSASLVVMPAVVAGIAISPGFTGNWFDPSQSGHGFSIEVLPGNLMLAEWFVFAPTYGGGLQTWIVATGPIMGNTAVLQGYYPVGVGGLFPPNFNPSQLQNQPWGTITFTFTDCNSGQVSWQPIVAGYTSGSIPITRLTMPAGLSCP
jgi:hypothetical protein